VGKKMKKFKKILVQLTTDIASSLSQNRIIKTSEKSVKVNLGCGLHCLPGWINIDGSLTSLLGSSKFDLINKIIYKLAGSSAYYKFQDYNNIIKTTNLKFFNLKNRVPLKDSSADVLYCSHFLEHLSKPDGKDFLSNCFRVLKSGGVFRIVVPDLDVAFAMYQGGDVEKMQDLFFYTSSEWDFSAHKYNYNFEYLSSVLKSIGFDLIERKAYREGDCPDINYLDLYPDHSLYVECIK
jgi:predicted SAM-dependent methyltransferase